MKKFVCFGMFAAVAVLFAGCASVEVTEQDDLNDCEISSSGKTIAHINAQNWGIYFLKWPLLAGSTDKVGAISVCDEDSVNVPKTVDVLTKTAKDMKASKVVDITSERSSITLPIPIPFLFSYKSTNVSGNAIR